MKWDEEKGQWKRSAQEGPPDLEKWFRDLLGWGSHNKPSKKQQNKISVLMVCFFIALLYMMSGFYIVRESESGIQVRLGKVYRSVLPGLNWRARWIDRVYIVNIQAIESFKKENTMLTEDENLVFAGFTIQYRKNNPQQYLFEDQNPILTLHQLAESCIRDVIGHTTLDEILTTGKQSVTMHIRDYIEQSLSLYKLGLEIVDVNLSFALPPEPVQSAFNDVIKAREDEQAYQNEAMRYRESRIPIAIGQAERITYEANGYCKSQEFKADATIQSFALLANQAEKHPNITRKRLYHETIDEVFSKPRKILIDAQIDSAPILAMGDFAQQSSTGSALSKARQEIHQGE